MIVIPLVCFQIVQALANVFTMAVIVQASDEDKAQFDLCNDAERDLRCFEEIGVALRRALQNLASSRYQRQADHLRRQRTEFAVRPPTDSSGDALHVDVTQILLRQPMAVQRQRTTTGQM